MRARHFILVLFLFISLGLCGCQAVHNRNPKNIGANQGTETEQSLAQSGNANQTAPATDSQALNKDTQKDITTISLFALSISVICLIICIFTRINARQAKEISERVKRDNQGITIPYQKNISKISSLETAVKDLTRRLETLENNSKPDIASATALDYGQEVTLQQPATKYFGSPIQGEGDSGYFYDTDKTGEPMRFRAEIIGGKASFEPVSTESIAYENSNFAVDFTGSANRYNFQRMTTVHNGSATFDPNNDRWLITEKAQVELI